MPNVVQKIAAGARAYVAWIDSALWQGVGPMA